MVIKNILGVVYDLDGTLISTEDLHVRAWQEAGRKQGYEISPQFLLDQKGSTDEAAAKMVFGEEHDQLGESFVSSKRNYVLENIGSAGFYQEFAKTYKKLLDKGVSVWVCTSAFPEFVKSVYEKIPALASFREKTVWKGMYTHGKPDPEPLLLTYKKMNLKPEQCLYVGDAYNDYMASVNAGSSFVFFCSNTDVDPRIPKNIDKISKHTDLLSLLGFDEI